MDEQQQEILSFEPTFAQRMLQAKVFAGGLLSTGAIDLLVHGGWPGFALGGALTFILARSAPDVYEQVKDFMPWSELAEAVHHREPGSRSVMDRLVGRHYEGSGADEEDKQEPPQELEPQLYVDEDCLRLGRDLHPHASQILSKRVGMFGIPGSGKTNGLTVFCEELGRFKNIGVPFVLADTEGEYYDICSRRYLMRPYYAHAGNINAGNALRFGWAVLEKGLQVVLDLQSYESDDEAALVMIDIIAGMRAWAEKREDGEARENGERATCMFILDEAAIWLPQRQEESTLSKEKHEDGFTLLARLQQAFFGTVVRRGRKRGIGFLFATQRPADLDKRCISCDWLMLFRQTFPNDLDKYAQLGVPKDAAQALAPGEAFVIDPHGTRTVYQFRKRYSPDNSETPGLLSLQKHAQRWTAAAGETRPVAATNQTPAQPVPAPMPEMEPLRPNPRQLTPLYRRALEQYRQQPGISYRDLGESIGVGKDKAGDILRDLRKWGYIAEDENEDNEDE